MFNQEEAQKFIQELETEKEAITEKLDQIISELGKTQTEEERKTRQELETRAIQIADEIEAINKTIEARNRVAEGKVVPRVNVHTGEEANKETEGNQKQSESRTKNSITNVRSIASEFAKRFDGNVNFKLDTNLDVRTIAHDADFKGDVLATQEIGYINPPSEVTILDLIPKMSTALPSISFYQSQGSTTGGATTVAEGGTKGTGTNDFKKINIPVEKIAVVETITDEVLNDEKSLESFIVQLLTQQVRTVLAQQIISGNGTSPNLAGILSYNTISTVAPSSAEAHIVSVRKAKTKIRQASLQPDTIMLNPADYEVIDLANFATSTVPTAPFAVSAPTLWGLTVVESNEIAEGTALVGSVKQGSKLWIRDDVTIKYTDSHSDYFAKNLTAIRAELRAGLQVSTPKAFCEVTFNTGA